MNELDAWIVRLDDRLEEGDSDDIVFDIDNAPCGQRWRWVCHVEDAKTAQCLVSYCAVLCKKSAEPSAFERGCGSP